MSLFVEIDQGSRRHLHFNDLAVSDLELDHDQVVGDARSRLDVLSPDAQHTPDIALTHILKIDLVTGLEFVRGVFA